MPKFNNLPPLHHAVSDDNLRPALTGVFIDGKHAVATDAHIMAVVDVSEHFQPEALQAMNGKIIPGDVWKMMCEVSFTETIEATDAHVSWPLSEPKGKVFYDYIDSVFPNYKAVVPVNTESVEDVTKIGVNIKNATRLLKALRIDDNVAMMYFSSESKAIIVNTPDRDGFGIIMPTLMTELRVDVFTEIRMNFITPKPKS